MPLFEPGTPSWSRSEYSSTPSILSPEMEVSYPWKITIADYIIDFQVQRMAKTKSTPCIRSPDELLAEGTHGSPRSAPSSSKSGPKWPPLVLALPQGRRPPPLLRARRGVRSQRARQLALHPTKGRQLRVSRCLRGKVVHP